MKKLIKNQFLRTYGKITVENKHYYDFIKEISSDEIYKGLLAYGLFTEKLPPIFTAKGFLDYCESKKPTFPKKPAGYIYHESMRNINTPRPLGIPNPVVYQMLCKYISRIWPHIQEYFEKETLGQKHKVSRTHIRKIKDSDSLFSMNYKNWKADGTPEPTLLFGARYLVHADISNFFPSIYTHALSWALVGRNTAKQNKKSKSAWYNNLDFYTRNVKHGETHGLLIGPHVSNLLSEIIMVKIDKNLYNQGWHYIRNIDDYTCYVSSYEKGQLFLTALSEQLRAYDLTLNHKKTSIEELPAASVEHWVRKINTFTTIYDRKELDFKVVRAFLDMTIELMQENHANASILNYAMKILAKKKLTENARIYYIKTIFHLSVIYPYLVSLLEDCVFKPFGVNKTEISMFSNLLYSEGIKLKNYEGICYALYYAIKYGFQIDEVDVDTAKNSNNCLFLLFSYLYYKQNQVHSKVKIYKEHAKSLRDTEMDTYWLFIYEALPKSELKDYWKEMKKNKVTFLKDF